MGNTHKDNETGLNLIGKIPESWMICRLGKIGTFSASGIDKKISEKEKPIHIINYTDVYGNSSHELCQKEYMLVSAPAEKCIEHI